MLIQYTANGSYTLGDYEAKRFSKWRVIDEGFPVLAYVEADHQNSAVIWCLWCPVVSENKLDALAGYLNNLEVSLSVEVALDIDTTEAGLEAVLLFVKVLKLAGAASDRGLMVRRLALEVEEAARKFWKLTN